jgi:hypothetical protein
VNPRAGLDDVEKRKFLPLPELEVRPLGRPARSQSLYRLVYPGGITMLCPLEIANLNLVSETKSVSKMLRSLEYDTMDKGSIYT